MSENRYKPPLSQTADLPGPAAGRPIAVWLLLVTLVVVSAVWLIGVARFALHVAADGQAAARLPALAVAIVWRAAVLLVLVTAIWGVSSRKGWSRWLGLLLIGGIAVGSVVGPDTTVYANDAERQGGTVARFLVIPMLLAWWAYAYGFSMKSRRYFGVLTPPA